MLDFQDSVTVEAAGASAGAAEVAVEAVVIAEDAVDSEAVAVEDSEDAEAVVVVELVAEAVASVDVEEAVAEAEEVAVVADPRP